MKLLYNIGLKAYEKAIALAAPFNRKAKLMLEGRERQFERLKQAMTLHQGPVAWFHCASLGEFEQGRPLMEAFKEAFPNYRILLTFFSPSGYEIRRNYSGAELIFYLPLDSAANAERFLDITRPAIAFFVKYEFWHYYIQAMHNRGIPVISVSAIFRQSQPFFKPYGRFYKNILQRISHIYTQNAASEKLLHSIGIKHTSIAGDTRFDRVLQTAATVKAIPVVSAFAQQHKIFVIGSSWPADMDLLFPLIQQYRQEIKFIIAPHEIHEQEITRLQDKLGKGTIRFSQANTSDAGNYNVLIIDNIGMLSSLYSYGTYAYVGGAFGKGLHNTLEAAVFGLPLFFGPKYEKFQEAKDLVKLGCAFPVQHTAELLAAFKVVHESAEVSRCITNTEKQYVQKQAGATQKIINEVAQLLKPEL